jgi:polygalacturonase
VIVQGCEMKDGHGGVVIGSEVSGGARNIYAEDCTMDSPNLDRAIRVKTNKIRGGTIENLFFRNISVGEVKEAVVRINMRYAIFSDASQDYIPVINNIHVENVNSKKSKYGILIEGYSDEHPVRGLYLKNCHFEGVEQGNKIEFATDLHVEDYYLNGELVQL